MLSPIARLMTRRRPRILMYHRFGSDQPGRKLPADVLDRQLAFIRRHFQVVPLNTLVAQLKSGEEFDANAVAFTVDDAYADFGKEAYPLFRRHQVPVTVYVVSEVAAGRMWLWWDAVRFCLTRTSVASKRLRLARRQVDLSLGDERSRHDAWLMLADLGNQLGAAERVQYLDDLQSGLSVPLPPRPTPEFAPLDWDALRSFDPALVDIGAHTRTHPILSTCTVQELEREIAGSKHEIEAQLGRRVSAFCYPNGQTGDVNDHCLAAVRHAGFDSAVMACGDLVSRSSSPYALERMSASFDPDEFGADVSGLSYVRSRVGARLQRTGGLA